MAPPIIPPPPPCRPVKDPCNHLDPDNRDWAIDFYISNFRTRYCGPIKQNKTGKIGVNFTTMNGGKNKYVKAHISIDKNKKVEKCFPYTNKRSKAKALILAIDWRKEQEVQQLRRAADKLNKFIAQNEGGLR